MDQVTVHAETEINPTETEEKVKIAICNILGDVSITITLDGKCSVLKAEASGQDSLVMTGYVTPPEKPFFIAFEETPSASA
jgi:hypothetical protein